MKQCFAPQEQLADFQIQALSRPNSSFVFAASRAPTKTPISTIYKPLQQPPELYSRSFLENGLAPQEQPLNFQIGALSCPNPSFLLVASHAPILTIISTIYKPQRVLEDCTPSFQRNLGSSSMPHSISDFSFQLLLHHRLLTIAFPATSLRQWYFC